MKLLNFYLPFILCSALYASDNRIEEAIKKYDQAIEDNNTNLTARLWTIVPGIVATGVIMRGVEKNLNFTEFATAAGLAAAIATTTIMMSHNLKRQHLNELQLKEYTAKKHN
ncbi:MAG: hypothetical protein Q8Q60_04270 [Candidatus Chromulinivorax sp.]|nr:hypothetical protein [Candidatus Chromulinivorax sp.]